MTSPSIRRGGGGSSRSNANGRDAIVAQAPVRIDFTGGYTDVAPFTDEFTGRSVNTAITRYSIVTARPRTDHHVVIRSEDMGLTVEATSAEQLCLDGQLDLLKTAIRRLLRGAGVEVTARSTAPSGAGLGTSAALGVAIVGAATALVGEHRTTVEIAELAAAIERESGTAGGRQDQYASALGGFNYLQFHRSDVRVEPISLSAEQQSRLREHLILAYGGRSRHSGRLISEVMAAYSKGDKDTHRALVQLNNVAPRIRAALTALDFEQLATLLDESRQNQEAMHPELVTTESKRLLDAAQLAGAQSGKIVGGAGPGACALLYCNPANRLTVIKALETTGWRVLPFDFEPKGLVIRPASGPQPMYRPTAVGPGPSP
jgi:D-glycero-alpha-D-manno-heptose-7-phosphate kinase